MINNRQAGRRRGRGGNNNGGRPGGGGGGGQRDSGNRIDSRARGNANQLYEKYKNLASDAQRQGDRVTTEYYLQFADHYFRVLSESRSRAEEQNQRRSEAQPFVGSFDTGFDNQDDEYADEGEPIRPNEQRMGEQRSGEQTAAEDRGARREGGDDRQRREGGEDRGQRDDRQGRGDRDTRRAAQPREFDRDAGEGGSRENGEGRRQRRLREDREGAGEMMQPAAGTVAAPEDVTAPVGGAEPQPVDAEAQPLVGEAPRRRGRPRRERAPEDAPAFDPAVLPPSLGIAPAVPDATGGEAVGGEVVVGAEPKPRRRRVRAAPEAEAGQAAE